jgi:hypothetical protein
MDTFRRFLTFHLNLTQSFSSYLTVNAVSITIAKLIVLRREIIAVCSMKGRKIIKILCGENKGILMYNIYYVYQVRYKGLRGSGAVDGNMLTFTRSYITFCVALGKNIIRTRRKYTEGVLLPYTHFPVLLLAPSRIKLFIIKTLFLRNDTTYNINMFLFKAKPCNIIFITW